MLVDKHFLKLHRVQREYPPIRLDHREFPVNLMQRNPAVWDEFASIVKDQFNAEIKFDARSDDGTSSSAIIIKLVDSNNNQSDEKVAALESELNAFRERNFSAQEMHRGNMPQSWNSLNKLLKVLVENETIIMLQSDPITVKFYGLKNDMNEILDKISKLLNDHLNNEIKTSDFRKDLTPWQIDYIKKFKSNLNLDPSLTLSINDNTNKLYLYGPSKKVDITREEVERFLSSLRQEALQLHPLLSEYFTKNSNLDKLRECVDRENLKVVLHSSNSDSGGGVHIVYVNLPDKNDCLDIIKREFSWKSYTIDQSESVQLVRKKFEQALVNEKILQAREVHETLFFEAENTLVFVGKSKQVNDCYNFLNKFIKDNKVNYFYFYMMKRYYNI